MNKVIFSGRIANDPVIRQTAGENSKAVANFTLAVPRLFRKDGEPEADFFRCTAWGKIAEHIEKYWRKGMKALIEGSIMNEQWTDKAGQKRLTPIVTVGSIEFCEKKQEVQEGHEWQDGLKPDESGFMQIPAGIDENELPFSF